MDTNYSTPEFKKSSFHCPLCNVYSNQLWEDCMGWKAGSGDASGISTHQNTKLAVCSHCHNFSVWIDEEMVYPTAIYEIEPNPDLPEDIKADFYEAAAIVTKSPRGAAALLRLCIQKLCKELGEEGKDINSDIASMVKKGLPVMVQQSLDAVRVIGNDAVHPGHLELKDDANTAKVLFKLVNIVCDKMISEPLQVKNIFDSLPEGKRAGIQIRDKD